jgi:hypothetical protein
LTANWPIDEDRTKTQSREFRRVHDEVGISRFDAAVSKIIHENAYKFFPSVAEFRAYVPQASGRHADANCEKCHGTGWMRLPDYEARGMYRDPSAACVLRCQCLTSEIDGEEIRKLARSRSQHPDEFFGEADVIAMMRIAQERKANNQPPLDADVMIREVLSIRHAIQEKRA